MSIDDVQTIGPDRRSSWSRPPLWLAVALGVCLLVGLLRAILLVAHVPLVALANSYDEVRYTGCFDLYPDRADSVEPTSNSPQAPYAYYRFLRNDQPLCYWSSELLFQGAVVAVYRTQQGMSGIERHSVRWIGALKFAALFAVWAAFTLAWLRHGEWGPALANGVLLPILFADPANTIYLNTFYAEWTALLALYALCGLILLCFDRPAATSLRLLLAAAAFALAMSKIQHLLLPLVCGATVLGLGFCLWRRWPWQGKAILLGALAGLAVQVVQLRRDSDAIRAIDMFNRADVAFTGLLPNARDPAAAAAELGLTPACLRFLGIRAWQMDDYPGHACPGLENVTRGRELLLLLHEPGIGLRLWWHGVLALNPWLAPGLGLVEGGDFQTLPGGFFSISQALDEVPLLRVFLLGGPPLALILLLWPSIGRGRQRWSIYTALTVAIMIATLSITVLGDGLADTPKQGHLAVNAALAWWICALSLATGQIRARLQHIADS
ncbi:MAG: hypothetical protein P4L92_23260 [Rudaea sp.]|nr:hypothetical protein [Rudaea sp.]